MIGPLAGLILFGIVALFIARAFAIKGMTGKLDQIMAFFAIEDFNVMEYHMTEWRSVPLHGPWWRLMLWKDPVKAYGPLCQWLWRTNGNPPTDKTWWALYEGVYLGLTPKQKRIVNRDKFGMRHALIMRVGYYDLVSAIEDRIAHEEMNSQNNSCAVGAEEYEDIIAAQEIMHGL